MSFFFSYSRTFDKDKDGFLTTDELKKIMKDRMTKKDIDTMIKEADSGNYGMINYQGKNVGNKENNFKDLSRLL